MGKALSDLASVVQGAVTAQKEVNTILAQTPKSVPELSASKKDKFKMLEAVAAALDKQFSTTLSIVRLGSKVGVQIPSIPTHIPSLDNEVIGCGGVPRGRIVEIYGPESSGKTTICLHIVACEQKDTDNLCAYVDAEHSLDVTYAASLGVNVKELLISQPDSGEQALETVEKLIDSKAVSLIIVDSVAALVPQAELDGEMGDAQMGLQARLMSQACRKLRGKAAANGITIIFINQIREKIGVMFGSPETTTGGRALKFFASLRLDVRRKDVIGDKERPSGHTLKIKAVKNKVGPPMRETFVDLVYGAGLDTYKDLIQYGVTLGVIEKSGAWYSFNEERLGNGLTNAGESIRVNPEWKKKIDKAIAAKRKETNEQQGA